MCTGPVTGSLTMPLFSSPRKGAGIPTSSASTRIDNSAMKALLSLWAMAEASPSANAFLVLQRFRFYGEDDGYNGPSHRLEERRVGKECVSTCRSRWALYHSKQKKET